MTVFVMRFVGPEVDTSGLVVDCLSVEGVVPDVLFNDMGLNTFRVTIRVTGVFRVDVLSVTVEGFCDVFSNFLVIFFGSSSLVVVSVVPEVVTGFRTGLLV